MYLCRVIKSFKMMTCAIIDDEPLALTLLERYVQRTPFLELKGKYTSAQIAVDGIRQQPVELVFCDIQMPDLNGLDFAQSLPDDVFVVFTTAFSQYALEGYKVNAVDYLLKPIDYNDFLNAANKAYRLLGMRKPTQEKDVEAKGDSIFVKSDYKIIRIKFADIEYIEGLKDYVKIYLENSQRPIFCLTAMHAMQDALPSQTFFRIHRSYIVNMDKVQVLERGQIIFGEKRIPISDSYKEQVHEYIKKRLLAGR